MTLFSRYRDLFVGTGAAPALAASLLGRLSLGVTGLALLLLVRESTGSYAAAGVVTAAYSVSFAVFAPVRARSADRRGPVRVTTTFGVIHPLVLVALVLLAEGGAGAVVLCVAAVAAGASVPPIGAVMRALWGLLAARGGQVDLTTAYSLESVVIELCFVAGPLIVAVLTAVSGPSAAVLAAGAFVLGGALGLAASPALRSVVPQQRTHRSGGGPLRSPAVRALLLTVTCVGAGFGAIEVALPAYVETQGARPGAAGLLLAVWAGGSVVGGLTYGAVHSAVPHARQLRWLVGALSIGCALPLLATGPWVMGIALVLYGLTIAPFSACSSVLLGRSAPQGTVTEAFAWSGSAIFGGAALGNVASGLLVEHVSVSSALLVTAGTGLLALVATLGGRRALVAA